MKTAAAASKFWFYAPRLALLVPGARRGESCGEIARTKSVKARGAIDPTAGEVGRGCTWLPLSHYYVTKSVHPEAQHRLHSPIYTTCSFMRTPLESRDLKDSAVMGAPMWCLVAVLALLQATGFAREIFSFTNNYQPQVSLTLIFFESKFRLFYKIIRRINDFLLIRLFIVFSCPLMLLT
jgi:hypothetical protein